MGHDTHFLERLTRIDPGQVDLALSLYRNVPLVKAIVEAAAPAEADRVAIALDTSDHPPHVLVTRTGAFVTCLAGGMKHDLPVISRAAVAQAARDQEWIARQIAAASTIVNGHSAAEQALRVFDGPMMSREQAAELRQWDPVFGARYLKLFFTAVKDYAQHRWTLMRVMQLKEKHALAVLRFWEATWAIGHLHVASASTQRRIVFEPEVLRAPMNRAAGVAGCIAVHNFSTALRGAWVEITNGDLPRLLDDAEAAYRATQDIVESWAMLLTLLGIGLRFPRHRARVGAVLAEFPGCWRAPDDADQQARARWCDVLARPSQAYDRFAALAQQRLSAWGADTTGFTDRERLTALLYEERAIGTEAASYLDLLDGIAFIATCDVDELYLPEALVARLPPPDPDPARRPLVAHFRAIEDEKQQPNVVKPPTPGRNDPCHCGSGKKFKKCHGA